MSAPEQTEMEPSSSDNVSNAPSSTSNAPSSTSSAPDSTSNVPSSSSKRSPSGSPERRRRKRRSLWSDAPPPSSAAPPPPPPPSFVAAPLPPSSTHSLLQNAEVLLPPAVRQRLVASQMHVPLPLPPQFAVAPHKPIMAHRIYVGNLPYESVEQYVRMLFTPFGRIVDFSLPKEGGRCKGFCFIEYETEHQAQMAIASMQGFNLCGRMLKLGRPTALYNSVPSLHALSAPMGYPTSSMMVPPPPPPPPPPPSAPPTRASSGSGTYNRIYVGCIAFEINESHLRSVFESFGTIRSCCIVPGASPAAQHKGYGFIEFDTASAARDAVTHMDGFTLLGRQLRVGPSHRTGSVLDTSSASATAAAILSDHIPDDDRITDVDGDVSIKASERAALMQRLSRSGSSGPATTTSRCLVLRNMVPPDASVDDELASETREECTSFGKVERVVVQADRDAANPADRVLVFVLFAHAADAAKAVAKLHGRFFGGRAVDARLHPDLSMFAA